MRPIPMSTGPRSHRWTFRLAAEFGHRDVTAEVSALVERSGVRDGIVVVSVTGSTGAVTTIEYEDGALADLRPGPAGRHRRAVCPQR